MGTKKKTEVVQLIDGPEDGRFIAVRTIAEKHDYTNQETGETHVYTRQVRGKDFIYLYTL